MAEKVAASTTRKRVEAFDSYARSGSSMHSDPRDASIARRRERELRAERDGAKLDASERDRMVESLPEVLRLRGLTRISAALLGSTQPSRELLKSLDEGLRRAAEVVDALAASVAEPRHSEHRPAEILEELVIGWAARREAPVELVVQEELHAPFVGDQEASELLVRDLLHASHGHVVLRATLQAHRSSWGLMRVEIEDDGPQPGDVVDERLRKRLAERLGGACGTDFVGERRRSWWTEVLERNSVETLVPPPKGLRARTALVRLPEGALRMGLSQQLARWGMTVFFSAEELSTLMRPEIVFCDEPRPDDPPGVPRIVVGSDALPVPYRLRDLRSLLFLTLRRSSHADGVESVLREVGSG